MRCWVELDPHARPPSQGLYTVGLVILGTLLQPALAQSGGFTLRRADPNEALLEHRIAKGEAVAWLLSRRSPSVRGYTSFDGIIIAPANPSLNLKVIRRENGDHRALLGQMGRPGEPIENLRKLLSEIRQAHLLPYQLLAQEDMRELAVVYAPHGARLVASPRGESVLIELELPWEKHGFLDIQGARVRGNGR